METNVLYYGDNLPILRDYIPSESVDLVYLDPPFNSNRDYNIIFKDESGRRSDAQFVAFEDTWHWGPDAEATYAYLTNTARHLGRVPSPVSTLIGALRAAIGTNQMMAYLVEMTVRLVELHRVLKPTGSLYLHCDPTASHYLKIVLDAIFEPTNFINEIVWKRYGVHNDVGQGSRHFGRVHDILLFYGKTAPPKWNQVFTPLAPEYVKGNYRHTDADTGRPFSTTPLTGPGGAAKGNPVYEWQGHTRAWRYSRETMARLDAEGRLYYSRTGYPRQKLYLDESRGVPVQDVWADVLSLSGTYTERLGYPTQKPLALLERIIEASSNPGDVVLDPFCGCGTAVTAAQKLGRQWIGIDVTYLAIAVMRARLKDTFGLQDIRVVNQPTEVEGARDMAQTPEGRYQFQWWALGLVDALPVGGKAKKGADKGIDGIITFTDALGGVGTVLVSVKSGHVTSSMVRDLRGVLDREKAAIGLFITLDPPTRDMLTEAASAGLYTFAPTNRDYPRVQILTIDELLRKGAAPQVPLSVLPAFQRAPRVTTVNGKQNALFENVAESA